MVRRTPEEYNWDKVEFDETILTKHFTKMSSKQIKFVVVHHMAMTGKGDGKANDACYRTWQKRQASAHYGVDGEYVRQFVWDGNMAWATGNGKANRESISIEHANSIGAPSWKVSDKTMLTGAKLVAYLHWVYKLGRPVDGKTLRRHKEFTSTACPGPYLGGSHWKEYVKLAQFEYDRIAGKPTTPPQVPPPGKVKHYIVRAGDTLWGIARKFGTTVAKLTSWNKLPNANQIDVGQDLIVGREDTPDTPVPPKPSTKVPSDIYSFKFWKLTLPKGKPDEVKQPRLNGYKDQFFRVVEHASKRLGVAYRAYCGGVHTENTTYARCETREMWKNGEYDESEWATNDGLIHVMKGSFCVTHAPKNKPHGVVAQIHDDSDDVFMLRYEGIDDKHGKLIAEWSKGKNRGSVREYVATIEINQIVQYGIVAQKNGIFLYITGKKNPVSKREGIVRKGCYFKHGAYNQSNTNNKDPYKDDAASDYFEAVHFDNTVEHLEAA